MSQKFGPKKNFGLIEIFFVQKIRSVIFKNIFYLVKILGPQIFLRNKKKIGTEALALADAQVFLSFGI